MTKPTTTVRHRFENVRTQAAAVSRTVLLVVARRKVMAAFTAKLAGRTADLTGNTLVDEAVPAALADMSPALQRAVSLIRRRHAQRVARVRAQRIFRARVIRRTGLRAARSIGVRARGAQRTTTGDPDPEPEPPAPPRDAAIGGAS